MMTSGIRRRIHSSSFVGDNNDEQRSNGCCLPSSPSGVNNVLNRTSFTRYVVIEIFAGCHLIHEWQRAEIAEKIRRKGGSWSQNFDTENQLYRDLRKVLFDAQHVPSIGVQLYYILISLPPITAVLLYDRVYFFVNDELKMDPLIRSLIEISRE